MCLGHQHAHEAKRAHLGNLGAGKAVFAVAVAAVWLLVR